MSLSFESTDLEKTGPEQIDKVLADLAWSLWTELGVAGIERRHQNCLIALEELIILTAVIADSDPRLRDEAIDWCSKYHHFVSISRLRTLLNTIGKQAYEPFSLFAETLNSLAHTKWPTFTTPTPLIITLSGKSSLLSCEAPALLTLRLRAMFGVGIRADLLTFCLTQTSSSFTALDTTRTGYNKRSLAEVLDSLVQTGLLTRSTVGNRRQYTLCKRDELQSLIGILPKIAPDWVRILELIINLRTLVRKNQNFSDLSKATLTQHALEQLKGFLQALGLSPPPVIHSTDTYYLKSFSPWLLNKLRELAQGSFWGNFRIPNIEIMDQQIFLLMQRLYAIDDCLDGLVFATSKAIEEPIAHEKVYRENYKRVMRYFKDLMESTEELFKFPIYSLCDMKLFEILHQFTWEEFPYLRDTIQQLLPLEKVTRPDVALRQYQKTQAILDKFHNFKYQFEKHLKEVHFQYFDAHLLTASPKLYKRHDILELFSPEQTESS